MSIFSSRVTKLALLIGVVVGGILATVESAEAARRPRGPIVVTTPSGPLVSHN